MAIFRNTGRSAGTGSITEYPGTRAAPVFFQEERNSFQSIAFIDHPFIN